MDLVEFHDEDFRDITTILKLSDTTKDKLTFTVSYLVTVLVSQATPFDLLFLAEIEGCGLQNYPVLA